MWLSCIYIGIHRYRRSNIKPYKSRSFRNNNDDNKIGYGYRSKKEEEFYESKWERDCQRRKQYQKQKERRLEQRTRKYDDEMEGSDESGDYESDGVDGLYKREKKVIKKTYESTIKKKNQYPGHKQLRNLFIIIM